MKTVVFTGAGGNEVLNLERRDDPLPGRDQVLIAVSFAGLNPADVAQRKGLYRAPPGSPQDVPGLEVAGVVIGRGSSVGAWREGDRVFGIVGGGGLADRVVAHERHLARIPEGLADREAAGVPEAFITAHDALVTRARLGSGERLLVNGANGGVGTAAVQLASAAGAHVFAGVRSSATRERVRALGAEPVGQSELVERLRAEGGADVILELIGAENLDLDLQALAESGRVVIVGLGAERASFTAWTLMRKRASVIGTVMRRRSFDEKAAAVQAFADEVVPLLANGRLRAVIDRVFPVAEVRQALDYLSQPGKFGKVLIEFEGDASPAVGARPRSPA